MGCILEAASYLFDAAEQAAKVDGEMAARFYLRSSADYVSQGHFVKAAVIQRRVAAIRRGEAAWPAAAAAMSFAAELYESGDDLQQAARCHHEAGIHNLTAERFEDARVSFERSAACASDSNMSRGRVTDILLDALIAALASGDMTAVEAAVLRYGKRYFAFNVSYARRFALDVMECARDLRLDEYMDHVWNLDHALELAPYQLTALLRVYQMFVAELGDIDRIAAQAELEARKRKTKKTAAGEKAKREGGGAA